MDKNYNNYATGSLVVGIVAIVLWFFGITSLLSVVLGIVGICLAGKAKYNGVESGVRTGGLVTSIIGLIGGAISFVATVLLVSVFTSIASVC